MPSARPRALVAVLALVAVVLGAVLAGCRGEDRAVAAAGFRPAPTGGPSWAPKPATHGALRSVAEQRGDQLLLHTVHGDVTFWSGVNLGSTTPGHSPGELAITREDYRRWFDLMGRMGVRVVRVYTIHPPAMYQELLRYNLAHAAAPLYLVQGVYLPDESYLDSHNLFDPGPTRAMTAEMRDASAAVHGALHRDVRRGRASGDWTADVSPWVAAWIVGVEWDGESIHDSDLHNADQPLHRGRYFRNTADATPTERWIAARMDEMATDEAARGLSAPIAHVNWPTADPLHHPTEPLPREDLDGVDANHSLPTAAWPGGTFASYHAYPYYPDFQRHQPGYQTVGDAYKAYLLDLKAHHKGMPMMVSEFGVPSSLGSAHLGTNGRSQGDHSEQQALATDASMLRMFQQIGLAGGLLFAWTDEWFKFTWNTLPRQAPVDSERRALWHDPLTNEQHFGLLAEDANGVGRRVPWEARHGVQQVAVDHSASWLYLTVELEKAPTAPVRVGFDLVDGGLPLPGSTGSGAEDYAVTVDPRAGTARMLVRGDVDPVRLDGLPAAAVPAADADGWSLERMTTNRPYHLPVTGIDAPAEFLSVGTLRRGSWTPTDAGFDDRSTWQLQGRTLSLRLPWSMLGLADPSSKTAVVPRGGLPVGVAVHDIGVDIDAGAGGRAGFQVDWEGWNRVSYTERVKTGVQPFVDALVAVSR
ncbi:MAG: hypothetical protein ACXVYS_15390 [Oryzihumus sp.]